MRVVVIGAGMVGNRFADELGRLDADGRDRRAGRRVVRAVQPGPAHRAAGRAGRPGRADAADAGRAAAARAAPASRRSRSTARAASSSPPTASSTTTSWCWRPGARARGHPGAGSARRPAARRARRCARLDDAPRHRGRGAERRGTPSCIGGGPLGLEAACGLRHRGVGVTVVDVAATLLDRELDADVAGVARTSVRDLGIDVVARRAARVGRRRATGGSTRCAWPTDGVSPPSSWCWPAASAPTPRWRPRPGSRPSAASWSDDDLRTSDPPISAIGDCAETPAGVQRPGRPGWEQARALAAQLAHAADLELPRDHRLGDAAQGRRHDVVTMGVRASTADADDRVVTLSRPAAPAARRARHPRRHARRGHLLGAPELAAAPRRPSSTGPGCSRPTRCTCCSAAVGGVGPRRVARHDARPRPRCAAATG